MWTRTATALHRSTSLALAGCTALALTVALPAVADAARQTVVAGNARFQVLSPGLIRTEYAGDGRFEDSGTFNAVGRGTFPATPFTSSVSGGVLTIRTSTTTLTYRLGSGPFDAGNLGVRLNAGPAPVAAAPWHHLICAAGALCEGEDLPADGLGVANDHAGYTGAGFLAGFQTRRRADDRGRPVPRGRDVHARRPIRRRCRRRRQARAPHAEPVRRRRPGPHAELRPDCRLEYLGARHDSRHPRRRASRRAARPCRGRLREHQPRQLRRARIRCGLPARHSARVRRLRVRHAAVKPNPGCLAAQPWWRPTIPGTPGAVSSPN